MANPLRWGQGDLAAERSPSVRVVVAVQVGVELPSIYEVGEKEPDILSVGDGDG